MHLALIGASPDTGNLGVSAMFHAVVAGVARRAPDATVTVFDHGWGLGDAALEIDGVPVRYRRCGLRHSRRFHRRESVANARLSARLGGLGSPVVDVLRRADAILDASAGDSFSDVYGRRRFDAVTGPKRLALEQRAPLVLLPQTYGPFEKQGARRVATTVVRSASAAWARDRDSFDALRSLLGDGFDPARHRVGVDLAFSLAASAPDRNLAAPLDAWIQACPDRPIVGLNISSLLWDRRSPAAARLTADYREAMTALLARLLGRTDAQVVLLSHVEGPGESDRRACTALLQTVPVAARPRVVVAPTFDDPRHSKWLIGRLAWFCGSRMHATIAALSSGVPTAAVAYSPKARGVFATCGQEREVHDARAATTGELVEGLWQSWERRAAVRQRLLQRLPGVVAAAESQLDAILLSPLRSPA